MNILVVYDSMYGNTAKIAEAVGEGLCDCGDVSVMKVDELTAGHLKKADLVVVGSPTQRFRPLPAVSTWIKSIPAGDLRGKRIAVFDTRMTKEAVEAVKILAFFVRIFGYAAGAMEKAFKKSGAVQAAPGEGFYITDTEGPLVEGELERARVWALTLAG
jgi:flavodoxin